jgi:hypothetical protein
MATGEILALLVGGTYVLAAVTASAMLGYRVCMTSPSQGIGVRAHALGGLVFACGLLAAAAVASMLATATVLLLGGAM